MTPSGVNHIFSLAQKLKDHWPKYPGLACAYSFEGNSLRTRATFLKAISDLGLAAIELPNLLKTKEQKRHLAGYLDQWIDLYVVRESDHTALEAFALASRKPVINAMSARGHPCEVLSDAFSLWERHGDLHRLKFCIVGPPTNVLNSWVELCELLDLAYARVVPAEFADSITAPEQGHATQSLEDGLSGADVVLTDAWPAGFDDPDYQVTPDKLASGNQNARVIPCPPFDETREVSQSLIDSPHFAGYNQKSALYNIHKAILVALLEQSD
jgi:ornithine carbamoyltransferase